MSVFDTPENKPPDKPVPESGFVAENENPPVSEEDSRPEPENEPAPAEPLDEPKSRAKPKSAAARAKAKIAAENEAKVAAQPDPPYDVESPEGERKYGGWSTEGPEIPHPDDDEFDEYASDREPGEPAPEEPAPEPEREWSMEGDVRLLVESTVSDVYALVHGLEADVQTDVGEQIEAARFAVVRLLEAGALGGQDKTVHVKLSGFANPGNEPGEGTKDSISISIEQV